MPPRSGGHQLTSPQEFSRRWALVKARLSALRRAQSMRGGRELYQAILGLLPLLAQVEKAHDPCVAAGLSGLPSALQIASDAAALAVGVTTGACSMVFSSEQQRIIVRTMLRILLAFIPPHLEEDKKETQADQLLALFIPDKFIEDICTLLKDETRWAWLPAPPGANGLSIETEDSLMMVALLARFKTLSIEMTAVEEAPGKNGPMHRRGERSTPERMLAARLMMGFDMISVGPWYYTLSGLAMWAATLGAAQLGVDLPTTIYSMARRKKEQDQPKELAFRPSAALLAARGAWEGPRPLLRRSVLLLSYWPLPDHWAILEANEYIWKTLAVLLIAAHACRPAQLYEADRRELVCLAEEPHDVPRDALVWSGDKRGARGIPEWQIAQEPSERSSMMQAAEVLTLVHGLHHTFLRHECETREVLLEVGGALVATSLGILLQLSVARSAPTRALTSSTDVVQSHLSISAHSTNPSGIDFVMRAILSNQLSYRIEVSSPRCLALKRQQLQDLDMWLQSQCQKDTRKKKEGRQEQQQLPGIQAIAEQVREQLHHIPAAVDGHAWSKDWLAAGDAAARALFVLLHPMMGCRETERMLGLQLTEAPLGEDRSISICSLLTPMTMTTVTLPLPSLDDIRQGAPGAVTFSAAAATLGLLMHYALPGDIAAAGERIARCHTTLNLSRVVRLLPLVKGLSPTLHQKRANFRQGSGGESSACNEGSSREGAAQTDGAEGRSGSSEGQPPSPGAAPAAELLLLIASLYLPLALIRTAEVAAVESLHIPPAPAASQATTTCTEVATAGGVSESLPRQAHAVFGSVSAHGTSPQSAPLSPSGEAATLSAPGTHHASSTGTSATAEASFSAARPPLASSATGLRGPAADSGSSPPVAEGDPCSAEPQTGPNSTTAAAAGAVPTPGCSSGGTAGPTSASLVRDAVTSHLGTLLELACTALCALSELVGDAEWTKEVQEKEPALLMEALRASIEASATLTSYLDACVADPPFRLLVRSSLLDHLSDPGSTAYSSCYCLPGICQQLWAQHVVLLSGHQFFGRIYKPFSWGPTGMEYARAVGERAHDCFLAFMAALDTDANKGPVLDLEEAEEGPSTESSVGPSAAEGTGTLTADSPAGSSTTGTSEGGSEEEVAGTGNAGGHSLRGGSGSAVDGTDRAEQQGAQPHGSSDEGSGGSSGEGTHSGQDSDEDSDEDSDDDTPNPPYAPRCVTGSSVNQRRLLASWVLKMPPPGDLIQAMESSTFPETFSYQAQTELQVQLPLLALALLRQGGPATGFTEDTLDAVHEKIVVKGATLKGPGPWSPPSPLAESGIERDKAVRGHLYFAMQSVTNHYGFFRASGALRCNEPDLRGYYPPQDDPDAVRPPVLVSSDGSVRELPPVLKVKQQAEPERGYHRKAAQGGRTGKKEAGASGSQASLQLPDSITATLQEAVRSGGLASLLPKALGSSYMAHMRGAMGEAMHKKAMELMQESVQRTAKELLRKGPRTAAEARQEHEEEEGEDGDDNDEDGEEEEEEPQLDPRHQEAMMKGLRYMRKVRRGMLRAQGREHELEQEESQPTTDLMTPVDDVESPEHQAFLSWMHGELCGVLQDVLSYQPVKTA